MRKGSGFTAIAGGGYYSLGLRGCAFDLGGDLNNDCRMGMLDLALMGRDWMMGYDMLDCATMGSNYRWHYRNCGWHYHKLKDR